jgi:hypothetical protein
MSNGLVTIAGVGNTIVRATYLGVSVDIPCSTSDVTSVAPYYDGADVSDGMFGFAGTTYALAAKDQGGGELDGAVGSWSSSDPVNCPVDASTGVVSPSAATGATITYTHGESGLRAIVPITVFASDYTPTYGDQFDDYADDDALRANIHAGVTTGTHITPAPVGGSDALYTGGTNEGLLTLDTAVRFMGRQTGLMSFPDNDGAYPELVATLPAHIVRGWQYRIERYSRGGDTTPFGVSVQFTCGISGGLPGAWGAGNAALKAGGGYGGGGGAWRAEVGYNNGSSNAGDCNIDWYIVDNSNGTNVELSHSTPNGKLDFDSKWRVRVILVERVAPCCWAIRQWLAPMGEMPTLVGGVMAIASFQASSAGFYLVDSRPFGLNYNLGRPDGFILQKNVWKWEDVDGETHGDPFGILGAQPTPVITSLSVSSLSHGSTAQTIVINGTGFNENCHINFSMSGVTVKNYTTNSGNSPYFVVSPTTITLVVDVAADATPGTGTIEVYNAASQVSSGTSPFTIS